MDWANIFRFELETNVPFECEKCNDEGYIYKTVKVNGLEYEVAEECECRAKKRNENRINSSGLAALIASKTFDTYKADSDWQMRIKNNAMRYSKRPDGWFFIGGQVGCGKTHICTAIANVILERHPVLYMRWVEDMNKLKYDPEKVMLENFSRAEYLIIDDLFKYQPSHEEIEMTYAVINYRYMNSLPTIISSEKTIGEMMRIDSALASRIKEKSSVTLNVKEEQNRNIRLQMEMEET